MKKLRNILSRIFVLALFCHPAAAEVFEGYYGGENRNLYENSVVLEKALLEFQNLYIRDSLILENYGTISGDIFIDSQKSLFLKNSGTISGGISIGVGANLFLVVNDADGLGAINIARPEAQFFGEDSSSFTVLVDGVNGLDFAGLSSVAANADKLVLKDSTINFTPGTAADVPIELSGEVIFNLGDAKL
ncbi:MAG: hypothetical protein FWE50_04920, partial [Alphaproteobacteria bacterium]|nr:hypothetical protein [Alphaproteobacteria bacterium]